jgi:hypothetical protein
MESLELYLLLATACHQPIELEVERRGLFPVQSASMSILQPQPVAKHAVLRFNAESYIDEENAEKRRNSPANSLG